MDSSAWDTRYASTPGLVWSAEPNRFVVESVTGLTPGAALDLAAGEGRNAVWLAEQGWRVTAVDFSPVAVARGRELAAGGPQDPAVLLTPEAVVDGLAGLHIRRAETARRPVPTTDGGTVDALDTVVVATRPAD
ncbi:methyltransferase domain-containing protein [Micromonospora chersina]|uniref:methyltransferase domain-containing protein n=1 Tax=Micromonospora chersina TaxID=47854 RepID=UPI003712B1DE